MYRMAGLAVFSQEVTILTISSGTLQALRRRLTVFTSPDKIPA
jgi:hypothetical protein